MGAVVLALVMLRGGAAVVAQRRTLRRPGDLAAITANADFSAITPANVRQLAALGAQPARRRGGADRGVSSMLSAPDDVGHRRPRRLLVATPKNVGPSAVAASLSSRPVYLTTPDAQLWSRSTRLASRALVAVIADVKRGLVDNSRCNPPDRWRLRRFRQSARRSAIVRSRKCFAVDVPEYVAPEIRRSRPSARRGQMWMTEFFVGITGNPVPSCEGSPAGDNPWMRDHRARSVGDELKWAEHLPHGRGARRSRSSTRRRQRGAPAGIAAAAFRVAPTAGRRDQAVRDGQRARKVDRRPAAGSRRSRARRTALVRAGRIVAEARPREGYRHVALRHHLRPGGLALRAGRSARRLSSRAAIRRRSGQRVVGHDIGEGGGAA